MNLSEAEVRHIRQALKDYRELIESYPEITTNRKEDNLLIAEEIMDEDSRSRH